MAEDNISQKKQKKWHQKWWGVLFLLICALAFVYGAILIYQIVFYIDTKNSLKKINLSLADSKINIRDFVEKKDAPFFGDPGAKVVIVEFGDFQCPICKAEAPILKRLLGDESSVKLIFRNFPNPLSHPQALSAALAAMCANEQGKFWEYHDQLYANQNDLSSDNLKNLAVTIGLNAETFNQCLENNKYFSKIKSDMEDGLVLNITGTPTLYINGNKVAGNISYETLKMIIDRIKQTQTVK